MHAKSSGSHPGAGLTPLPACEAWASALDGWAATNDRLHETWRALSVEWQEFLGRRLSDDFRLLQNLSSAKAFDDIWTAWAGFWRKAAADYGAEYSAIARLAGGLVTKSAAMGQSGASETGTAVPQSKAA